MADLMKNFVGIAKHTKTVFGVISSADITGTAAGQFGHAQGYPIVVPVGSDRVVIPRLLIIAYDFATAAYTAGGNVTLNNSGGGSARTGLVSAANSIGAASDKLVSFVPLAAAAFSETAGLGLNLVTSAAFTQPGTAAGVVRYICEYWEYPSQL